MNRLLAANFARLWRSKIFYGLELFMIGYCMLFYRDAYITINVNHKEYSNWNTGFFGGLLPGGIALAVFISFYIGAEYSNGTIRNKIATGHSRFHIYLSNLFVCYGAAVIMMMTYCVTSLLIGFILIGKEAISGIWKPAQGIGMMLCILMAYTAILVFVAMLDMNIARTGVVSLLLTILLLAAGIMVIQYLEMPEYMVRLEEVQDESGETKTVERTVYNSKYLSGEKRELYEWAKLILPSAQVMEVINRDVEYSVKQPICMFGELLIFTGAGIWIFLRKDIK
ncbi:MAG: ABC transporter permease [Lachnospiraceae bacterium]|nr:ABC transporter permease [Lachnospiraceae bacterium]